MKKEKAFLFSIDRELHATYKKMCKENGFNMSQRIRNFISEEVKQFKNLK